MRFNIYDDVKVVGGTSLAPQSFTGSTAVDGSSINTAGYETAAIYAYGAAVTGSPSAATLVVTLQESVTGTSGWTNALDNTGTVIGFTLNCESVAAENIARIEGLNGLNRHQYLRAVITPAFTGGSSPAILGFAQIILGNSQNPPVDTNVSNT